MKRKKQSIIRLTVAALLTLYLGSYALCRVTGGMTHTANVLNLSIDGRYHMIYARSRSSSLGSFAETVFLPLREAEARYHGRGGRLD